MANNKLSILDFLGTAYDIDALYLGGVAADKFARRDINNSFTGKNSFSAGVKISGRYLGAGDDEGLVIGRAENDYAGVCLGEPAGIRSVFYLKPDNGAIWRYNNGTSGSDIAHPGKGGTIALTSDIPTKLSQLTNDSGYTKNAGTVTSVRVQAGTGLSSSVSTAQTGSLNTTISIASGYKLPTTTEWNGKASTATVTTTANGLMSSTDKTKLNNITSSNWSASSSSAKLFLIGATAQGTSPQTYSSASNYILGSGQFTTEAGINVNGDASIYFTNGGDFYTDSSGVMHLAGEAGMYVSAPNGDAKIKAPSGNIVLEGSAYVQADAESISLNANDGNFSVYSEGDTYLRSNTDTYIETNNFEVSCSSFLVNGSPVVTQDVLNTLGARLIFQRREQDPNTGLYNGEWRDVTTYTEYTSSTSTTINAQPASSYSTYSRYVLEITRGHLTGSCSVSAGSTGMSVQSLGSYRYKIQFLNTTSSYQKITVANGTKTIVLNYKFTKSGYTD